MSNCAHERTWMVRVWRSDVDDQGIAHVCRGCGLRRWDDDDYWHVGGRDGAHELLPPHPAVTEPPATLVAVPERLRVRAELAESNVDDLRAYMKRSIPFTQEWYAERLERLRKLAEDHGILREFCAIVANGTAAANEPPTYARLLNRERFGRESAEKERDQLRAELAAANRMLDCIFGKPDAAQDLAAHARDVAAVAKALTYRRDVGETIDWGAFFERRRRFVGGSDTAWAAIKRLERSVENTVAWMEQERRNV